jgi:serine/threonine protein kinase
MSYCVNPQCSQPHNSEQDRFCQSCGKSLLLIERYRALKPLGKGGFGQTFLGVDEHLPSKPYCVIKQLYAQYQQSNVAEKVIQLFEQEALHLDQLGKHDQIPGFLGHFAQDDQLYLIQEFIQGHPLSQESWGSGTSESLVYQILRELLPVLQFIHEQQIIHRDLKPDNIIRRDSDRKLVLIDFGISRIFSETAIVGGATLIGTPEYMAPEIHRGQVFPASDLYSLGVTCLRLLTGMSPLKLFNVVNDEWEWRKYLRSNNQISYRLGKIIDRLIHPSLRLRYQSASEVLQALDHYLELETLGTAQPISQPIHPSSEATEISPVPSVKNEQVTPTFNIDYSRLKKLLSRKKWREADTETWYILSQLSGKNQGIYLFQDDIKKLPCDQLYILDSIWREQSHQKFGFSIQKEIYEQVNGEYDQFCQMVGWPSYRSHNDESDFNFSEKANRGHLPSRRWVGGVSWWKHAKIMTEKISSCAEFSHN